MTAIQNDCDIVTLINVFHVKPENQQALVDLLIEATERTIQHQPGFISPIFIRAMTAGVSSTMHSGRAAITSRPC
jgi:hypothetical protein